MKTFAENLSSTVKAKRFSIKEVSKGTGIPRTTLNEWMLGRCPQVSPDLVKLASFLGVSLHYLLTGEENTQEAAQAILQGTGIPEGRYEITIRRLSE